MKGLITVQDIFKAICMSISIFAIVATVVLVVSNFIPEPIPEEPTVQVYSDFDGDRGLYIVGATILSVENLYDNGWLVCIDNKPIRIFDDRGQAFDMLDRLMAHYRSEHDSLR